MNIAVLMGGISSERNISLLSGRAVTRALRERGHTVQAFDPARGAHAALSDADLDAATNAAVTPEELAGFRKEALMECVASGQLDGVDIVFNLLHGQYGEDGYMQALLHMRGLRFTGSGMTASAIAMDKGLAKMLFQVSSIPTAHWVTLQGSDADNLELLEEVRQELKGPVVVKPNDGGSTVGMTIVETGDLHDLQAAVKEAARFTNSIIVERYVRGREFTVAVLGDEALPVIEIVPHEGTYDYQNKYTKGRTEYHCPADLEDHVREHMMSLAVTAHRVLGCTTYSRVDVLLTEDQLPVCLEVNTVPGFTELSLVPMAAKAVGIGFADLCEDIIHRSLDQQPH
jgi:D-alanine-D-alanine ligase